MVIPAFNEQEHIYHVVEEVFLTEKNILSRTDLGSIEVIVVNDGSTDETQRELDRLALLYPKLVRRSHPRNRGYGAALKTGFECASGDYVAFMDGDGTIHPESFIDLYNELQKKGADLAIGRRFGKHGSKMPMVRKIGNHFFAHLLTFLSGIKVYDTASGVRLFHRTWVPHLRKLPDGLHFTPAMSAKLLHENVKTVEVPIAYAERSGESKLKVLHDGLRFLHIIISTVLLYNPFKIFLLVGMLSEVIAFLLLAYPMYLKVTLGSLPYTDYIYRSIGALYFFVAGIQIILFGILARFMVATFFKRHEASVWVHRLNDHLKVYDRMGWYGAAITLVGIVINLAYFFEYLKGKLNLHWSWLLFAAGLIIIGVQMMITGVVMRVLKDIHRELSE